MTQTISLDDAIILYKAGQASGNLRFTFSKVYESQTELARKANARIGLDEFPKEKFEVAVTALKTYGLTQRAKELTEEYNRLREYAGLEEITF